MSRGVQDEIGPCFGDQTVNVLSVADVADTGRDDGRPRERLQLLLDREQKIFAVVDEIDLAGLELQNLPAELRSN